MKSSLGEEITKEHHDTEGEEESSKKKCEDKNNGQEKKDNYVTLPEIKVKIELKKEDEKELTVDEKIAEEKKNLAESYRKHKIERQPSEEFWVPVSICVFVN